MIWGIGIDIVKVERIQKAIERSNGRFQERVFTEKEIEYCRRHRNPNINFAGRFAAKEAFFKCLGVGQGAGIRWQEIEVESQKGGSPRLLITGSMKKTLDEFGGGKVFLSISHTDEYAVANVVVIKGSQDQTSSQRP